VRRPRRRNERPAAATIRAAPNHQIVQVRLDRNVTACQRYRLDCPRGIDAKNDLSHDADRECRQHAADNDRFPANLQHSASQCVRHKRVLFFCRTERREDYLSGRKRRTNAY